MCLYEGQRFDKKVGSAEKERAVDAVYLDFREAFDIVSHNIFVVTEVKYGAGHRVRWVVGWALGYNRW